MYVFAQYLFLSFIGKLYYYIENSHIQYCAAAHSPATDRQPPVVAGEWPAVAAEWPATFPHNVTITSNLYKAFKLDLYSVRKYITVYIVCASP